MFHRTNELKICFFDTISGDTGELIAPCHPKKRPRLILLIFIMKSILDKNNRVLWFSLLILALLLVLISSQLNRQKNEMGGHDKESHDSSRITPGKVVSGAFREIRVTLADLAWIKVDDYFHASVTPEEHEMIHPGHPEHLHGHTNSSRTLSHDADLMPLIEVVTKLDPQFLEAYRVGSWWLWKKLNAPQQAIDFLQEGLRNNPDRYELNYDLGLLYFHKLQDYSNAKIQFRLASRKKMEDWDRANVMEYLAFTLERLKDPAGALDAWKDVAQLNIQPFAKAAQSHIPELQTQIKVIQEKPNALAKK